MIDLGSMTVEQRRATFLGIVRDLAPKLSMHPERERARLEALTPDRVELAVSVEEYEAARANSLRVLGGHTA